MSFSDVVEGVGKAVDGVGITIIVIGVVASSARFLTQMRSDTAFAYRLYGLGLGRAILLGLEFLIAGDIIRTVATSPTFRSVGILGTIVLIRTFLSFALTVELEGRLPRASGTDGSSAP